jgi:prefoldin subunit 5
MNDNLRYVSLQYIKGENYEDVDSFNEREIRSILNKLKDADLLDNPDEVKKLYGELEGLEGKKKIGESFLEDLINYSSLKLIKTDLDAAKKKAEDKIKKIKDETDGKGDGNKKKGAFIDARSKIAQSLVDVIAVIDMVKRDDISEPPAVDDETEPSNPSTLLEKAKKFLKKKVKEYLSKVETTKGKIDKIEKEITELETQVNDTTTDKGTLLQHITSDFEKLKANAIKSVEKFKSDAKISIIEANITKLLTNISSLKKIDINSSSHFYEIKEAVKQEKIVAEEAAKASVDKAALDKAALDRAAGAAKAKVLFDNVEFAITKLNKEIDIVNANKLLLTKLKDEVEKVKTAVKEAVEEVKTAAKAPTAGARRAAAQTPQEAQEALSAELKKIEQHLETAKTDLEEAYKLLEDLRKNVIEQSDTLEKEKKDYLKSLDKLVALYSSYLKICTKNISRYDKLFEHNEISNIDEAFMIKSYSDFLKKLNKLKQNLETKDIGKIRRALTDSINRLFNMYGVNTNNEAFMKAFLEGYLPDGKEDTKGTEGNDDKKTKDIDYIINRIINYNLAM